MVDRGNNLVGDQIDDEIGSGGAREAQLVDLNRSRTAGQDTQPGIFGVAFEVN